MVVLIGSVALLVVAHRISNEIEQARDVERLQQHRIDL